MGGRSLLDGLESISTQCRLQITHQLQLLTPDRVTALPFTVLRITGYGFAAHMKFALPTFPSYADTLIRSTCAIRGTRNSKHRKSPTTLLTSTSWTGEC